MMGGHSLYAGGYAAGYGQDMPYRGRAAAGGWEQADEEEEEEYDEDDDEEPEDSSDSDYGSSRKKGKAKKPAAARRPARTAAAKPKAGRAAGSSRAAAGSGQKKRARKRAAYADDDGEDSAEDTSDSDDDSEPAGYGAGSRRDYGAAAAAPARRPRRQAAAKANENIKHTYEDRNEFDDPDDDNTLDEHAAAAAAPVPAPQFAQYYAMAHLESHPLQQPQYDWQQPAAAQNGGSWYQQQAEAGPVGNGSYAQEAVQEPQQQAQAQQQQQVDWGRDSYEQQQNVEQEQPQQEEQEQHWQHDHVQQQQQEGEQDMYEQEGEQQQLQHQQHWQRSPETSSPQHWQSAAAQQSYAVPSPAPRYLSAPLATSRATAASRPGARASGRSASAATAATASRRPSRTAATVKSSYYEGSDDSAEDEEAGADYMDYVSSSSGTEEDSGAESGSEEGSDGDVDADYQYALQMQEELNGMRARPTRQRQASRRDSSPSVGRKRGASGRTSEAVKRRRTRTTANKISYAESGDSSDDSEARAAAAAARREPLPALEDTGDGWEADGMDEVERVLGHRVAAANGSVSTDAGAGGAVPWSNVEFHVKWRRLSFIHTSWQPLEALRDLLGFKRVLNYMKRVDAATANRAHLTREEVELIDVAAEMEQQLLQQYKQVERVIAERPGQSRSLLVKWEGLPYCEATWEAAEDVMAAQGGPEARDDFLTRQQRMQETARGADAARNAAIKSAAGAFLELQEQPALLSAGKLRDYQLEGLNWLTYAWLKDRNAILADEMGLGKTIQCVSLVGLLAQHMNVRGPFLVVVPLSTVPNWIKEFRKWVPMVNAVVYVGDGRSREVIRAFEFPGAPSNRSRPYGFEAIITTYELVLKDAALLRQIPWAYLLVDEAHRLKNSESALYQELSTWSFKNKLLVTGTPLQNSMRELWALLNFLEPGRFGPAEEFEAAYRVEGAAMSSLSSLHSSLKPHLLRRVIKDVETSLPPKTERILRVEMTPLQRQYYKWILSRNFKELNKGARGHVSLLNILTELKKACNHPFLFESAEDEYRLSDEHTSAVDRLVRTSGKMVLLDKLMRRLRETGHRVLIFSQMVRVLDIISDYLRLRGYPHQRLDGSTPAAARHAAMEAFNRPDSPDFAFLLSTRAGGLGINLATADTVIIFDSDWNPQNDLQAMSRAHRIGQTETVNIYRFVTSGSVEEEILERAKRKMVLDHLVIQRMDTSGRTVLGPAADSNGKKMFGKDELAAILRFGAEDLFKAAEEGSAERSRRLLEEDIDDILSRAEVVTQQPGQQSVAGGASDLLSSFNVATFKNEEDDATFWSRLIAEPDRAQDDLTAPLGPRAARTKQQQQVDSRSASPTPQGSRQLSQQYSDDVPAGAGGSKPKPKKPRRQGGGGGSRASDKPGAPVEGAALRIDRWPLEPAQDGKAPTNTRGLSKRDAAAFVRAVRRYGLQARLSDAAAEVGGAIEAAGAQAHQLLWDELVQGCRKALELAAEQDKHQGQLHDPREVTLDFFGCAVKASEFSQHLAAMDLLATQVIALQSSGQDPCVAFRLEAGAVPAPAKWGKALGWTPRDDAALLLGVFYHGLGHWEAVVADARLGLQAKLGAVLGAGGSTVAAGREDDASGAAQVVPKASHLETRVLGILRKMLLISGQPVRTNSRPRGGHKGQKAAAGAGAPSAGTDATAGSAAAAAASAAERKAAKKAAARRAAALAAAGITGERNTPTPPPPPVHKQPPLAGKQMGGRQLGPVGARPRLPDPKRNAKPPSGHSAEKAAAAAAAAAKRERPAAHKAASAKGVQPDSSKRPEGCNASTPTPQAAKAGTAATAGEGSQSASRAAGSKAGAASAHGPAASRAVSPFASAAAAGGAEQASRPVSTPRPPPLPSSPTPEQQQQQQEAPAAPRLSMPPLQPAAGVGNGGTQAAGDVTQAPRPAAAGKRTGARQAQPKTAATGATAAAAALTASKLPQPAPAAAGSNSKMHSDQELQAILSCVSSQMQGLLQLNASAAAGEEQEDQHKVVKLTKAYLLAIGQAVERAAAAEAATNAGGGNGSAAARQSAVEQQLWTYVVKTVQTPMSQQQFAAVCKKLVRKNTAAAAAGGPAKGSSSGSLPVLRVATATVAGQRRVTPEAEQPVAGAALTPGKDPPLYDATDGGTAFGDWQQQQLQQQDPGHAQQQQQQQRQQGAERAEQGRARRGAECCSREHSRERGRDPCRGEARRSSSRSRSKDRGRGRGAGSSRERARSSHRRLPGTGSDRRSRSSSRDTDRGRSRSNSRDRGRGRDSRSSSRDRARDRRTGRSRSAERYSSRGYRHRQQYSSSYRRYRSYSRSRSRDRQQYDSSRHRGRQRSRSRSRSRSRHRSRSYVRGRSSRQYSRSRSRSKGRSRTHSRGRSRSRSRDRDKYRGTDRGR